MNILKAICIALVLSFSALSAPVSALPSESRPELSARQLEIMKIVRSVDGYINKELHDEFWSLMPSFMRTASVQQDFKDLLYDVSEARQDFLKQTQLSAKESLNARQIIRTQGYLDAKAAVLSASSNPGYQTQIRESIASAERWLAAAANRTPFEITGSHTYITTDLIKSVLSGIQASEFRFSKLVEPKWDGKLTEFKYPDAHVSILALAPFTLDQTQIRTSGAGEAELVSISQSPNLTSYVTINFVRKRGRYSDPVNSLISNASSAIEGAGATGHRPVFMQWREKDSATANGAAQTSEGDIFVSFRVVEIPEIYGVLQFMAISQLSAADAINARGILEESSNIIP